MNIGPLPASDGALYLRLAAKIAGDITNGTIMPGERLPTQRQLADELGTTIGTVGRAYALLFDQGLVTGEVGRGTFVLGQLESKPEQPAPSPRVFSEKDEALQLLRQIAEDISAIRAMLGKTN